jgi:hypothetical protein
VFVLLLSVSPRLRGQPAKDFIVAALALLFYMVCTHPHVEATGSSTSSSDKSLRRTTTVRGEHAVFDADALQPSCPGPTSTPRLFRPSAVRGEGGGRRRRAAGRHEGGQGTRVIFCMSAMGVHCGPRRSASVRADENAAAGFDAARGSPGRRRPPAARSSLPSSK